MIFDVQIYTNVGNRTENQDSFNYEEFDDILVSCVADGVGGRMEGKEASELAVTEFIKEIKKANYHSIDLKKILYKIHCRIMSKNNGMATTFTGLIIKDKKLKGIHTGDTRACVLRGNGIKQLTENHTEVARLVREGLIDVDSAKKYPRRNQIESALGIDSEYLKLFEFEFDLETSDRIILTTDGVHETISKKEFRDISLTSTTSVSFLDKVVEILEIRKPNDNNTIMVITLI